MARTKQTATKYSGKSPRPALVGGKLKPYALGPKVRKNYRFKAGTVAIREIKKMQKSTDPIFPLAPFYRLTKSIMLENNPHVRVTKKAIEALREAVEAKLVELFENTNLCAIHAKRTTINETDMRLARRVGEGHAVHCYLNKKMSM